MAGTAGPSHKRKLASPKEVEYRSLTALREKLVKIGAKVVRHGRADHRKVHSWDENFAIVPRGKGGQIGAQKTGRLGIARNWRNQL